MMAEDHRLASKASLMLQDLDGEEIVERTKCGGCHRLRQACSAAGVMPRFRHQVDSDEQLQNLILAGFGIGFATRSPTLAKGIVARTIERIQIERAVSLATVAGRPFSAATDAFVRLARMRDWGADLWSHGR